MIDSSSMRMHDCVLPAAGCGNIYDSFYFAFSNYSQVTKIYPVSTICNCSQLLFH